MNSEQERNLARRKYAATVVPFCQGTDNLCKGYVPWWVRKRAKGKSIWSADYFTPFNDRFVGDEENKGYAKGVEFQKLFFGNDDDQAYITKGIRQGKDKPEKEILKLFKTVSALSVSQNGSDAINLIAHFFLAEVRNDLATVSIMAEGGSHALGLDFSTEFCFYFDPNLGEFRFSSEEGLSNWWRDCYKDRRHGNGAFAIMGQMFSMNFYSKI